MKKFKVLIPKETYSILDFKRDDLPAIAVVNNALRKFEPKEVFAWQLSIIIDLKELIKNGMPSKKELKVVNAFGDFLDDNIKGPNKKKPNALFLARITWNATRQIIWRVFDPEVADSFLKELIQDGGSAREFEYRMEADEQWKFAEWYLKDWPK
ncbi:MAG: DUF695 domain-containing protein [Chryseolinea sp.]